MSPDVKSSIKVLIKDFKSEVEKCNETSALFKRGFPAKVCLLVAAFHAVNGLI